MKELHMDESSLLKVIIEKESWEEVIYYIVNIEKIDPWNVDVAKLCDGFISFIRRAKELDFKIPAKVVFVASILLRMKAEYLLMKEEEEIEKKEEEIPEFFDIKPEMLKLAYPIKRIPRRQVTLSELILALKRIMDLEKKRKERKERLSQKLQKGIDWEEDIEKRIQIVLQKIEELYVKKGKVEFREIVERWEREEIVKSFLPLLHLEKNKEIKTEQEDFFKEIWIYRRK
ncbi:MAG: segregation/condensation protein A [Candidatus Aenigmarchaeota archaeon]|nr:segregation/condensation protein A [Candidatus Aenigmarchaeota archaeon]